MANKKISQLPAISVPLAENDLFEVAVDLGGGASYESRSTTGKDIKALVGGLTGFHSPFPLASGQKTSAFLSGAALSGGISVAERAMAIPYMPAQNITTSDLYINVSSGAAGALARVYIYSDLNLYPDQLLFQSANIDCSTSGIKTLTTTFNFDFGKVYWLVTHTSTGTQPQLTNCGSTLSSLPVFRFGGTGTTLGTVIFTTITFAGAVPTTFPAGGTLSATPSPFIGITKA